MKSRLTKCQGDVMNVLTAAVGTLRQFKEVSPAVVHLREYFLPGTAVPPEMWEFQLRCTDVLALFEKKKDWWPDTSQIVVALIGVAQIVGGALLICCSGGLAAHAGAMLMSEGVSDIMMAVQAYVDSERITAGTYLKNKAVSVAMTVACAGVGAYLARGAKAAKITEGLVKNQRTWILPAAVKISSKDYAH